MIEAIRAITTRSIQRVWRVWEVKLLQDIPLYKTLDEMLTSFQNHEDGGKLFAELCMEQEDW